MRNKTHVFLTLALFSVAFISFGCGQKSGAEKRIVLCSTFPIYQLTRNVVGNRKGVQVQLMLPSQLGCPHDYALTPQDMQKLAEAEVLVVNGLGMEAFLGAPEKKANQKLTVIDSSRGIKETLEYTTESQRNATKSNAVSQPVQQSAQGFEWAGVFTLEPGTYRWSFAKVNGKYADPAMNMLFLASSDKKTIESVKQKAIELSHTSPRPIRSGNRLSQGENYRLQFDTRQEKTIFDIRIDTAGTYTFFTEHLPYEFEAKEHFFRTAKGADVEPIAEVPKGGHHHHHGGVNPHLFASPRMAARLVTGIAAQLSKVDPTGAAHYSRNAKTYAATLNSLADEMSALGKKLKNNRIVQPHGIFDYLARDMGLDIVAVMQAHGQEPSAAEMLQLVKIITEKNVGGIFFEPQYPKKVGQTLSRETGVTAALLDPVASGPENAPIDYYEKTMRENMKTLGTTLGLK